MAAHSDASSIRPLILHADVVRTMDRSAPVAQAVGVHEGRIVAVGSLEQVRAELGPDAIEERVTGTILPGFIDAHHHASLAISDRFTRYLSHPPGASIQSLLSRLAEVVRQTDTAWVRAQGYNPLTLKEIRGPTAEELDSVCADRPLVVVANSCHEASLNTRALAAMDWNRNTPDPPGGKLLRDRRGNPNGIALESAAFAVEVRSATEVGTEEGDEPWLRRCEAYCQDLLRAGITRIGDASVSPGASRLYELAASTGRLPLTVHRMPMGSGAMTDPRFEGPATGEGPPRAPIGPAKLIVDGGDHCALCLTPRQVAWGTGWNAMQAIQQRSLAPFKLSEHGGPTRLNRDGTFHRGIRILEDPALARATRDGTERGFQVALHALGNEAVDAVLASLAPLERRLANLPGRARVEHAMLLNPGNVRRIAASAAMVVGNPSFIRDLGDQMLKLATPPPFRRLPLRSLLDAGVLLGAGSDYPVVPFDVLPAIQGAVTRRTAAGKLLDPEEAITVEEALRAYTVGGAAAFGVENQVGTISPGKVADLVVLSGDPLSTRPDRLSELRVLRTYVVGRLTSSLQAVAPA